MPGARALSKAQSAVTILTGSRPRGKHRNYSTISNVISQSRSRLGIATRDHLFLIAGAGAPFFVSRYSAGEARLLRRLRWTRDPRRCAPPSALVPTCAPPLSYQLTGGFFLIDRTGGPTLVPDFQTSRLPVARNRYAPAATLLRAMRARDARAEGRHAPRQVRNARNPAPNTMSAESASQPPTAPKPRWMPSHQVSGGVSAHPESTACSVGMRTSPVPRSTARSTMFTASNS